jgi:flagellar protein FlaG
MYNTVTTVPRISGTNSLATAATGASKPPAGDAENVAALTDTPPVAGAAVSVDAEQLTQALERLSGYVQNLQRNLEFSVDKDSGRTVVRIVDPQTQEVIRQIPDGHALAMSKRLEGQAGSASGVLLDETI